MKWWDDGLTLVDGCTPCSLGCVHCWAARMTRRFDREHRFRELNAPDGKFNGVIVTRPERLSIPRKRRKPTVYSIWNDWAHELVSFDFMVEVVETARECPQHTFLALTKRPHRVLAFDKLSDWRWPDNWWNILTICNQQEADEKLPIFLQLPGKKGLNIEPMLSPIDITEALEDGHPTKEQIESERGLYYIRHGSPRIDAVILGAETGPGARPMHPDWVRSARDQCAAAGVPFFFKQWGEWMPIDQALTTDQLKEYNHHGEGFDYITKYLMFNWMGAKSPRHTQSYRVGRKNAGRALDGRTHDELPWRSGT